MTWWKKDNVLKREDRTSLRFLESLHPISKNATTNSPNQSHIRKSTLFTSANEVPLRILSNSPWKLKITGISLRLSSKTCKNRPKWPKIFRKNGKNPWKRSWRPNFGRFLRKFTRKHNFVETKNEFFYVGNEKNLKFFMCNKNFGSKNFQKII